MEVRPIDANALHAEISKWHESVIYKDWVQSAIANAPTLTTPNEPLTLEQLNDMDGQPVWDKNGRCYLVDTIYRFCSCADYETVIVDNRGEKHKPNRYTLYHRPPEGEEDT